MKCPLCNSNFLNTIYNVRDTPIFQNKVYNTNEEARMSPVGKVSLVACWECGFVFNSDFDNDIMNYDIQYQNEQGCSGYFRSHIDDIVSVLLNRGFDKKRIVEIGCGKGYFLEELQKNLFNIVGFDPAYEGDNPKIVKDYFTEKYQLDADLIILRHVIEHVSNPLELLHNIGRANNYKGMIFIETPDFDWIVRNKTFFDIFHEHCSYFTPRSLSNVFGNAESGTFFNGQYMYIIARLEDLLKAPKRGTNTVYPRDIFQERLNECCKFVENHKGLLVHSAGAKGITFTNLTDPGGEYISYLVDINPKKQNKYIAKTAHKIISPELLTDLQGCDIIVMNDNYLEEIQENLMEMDFNIHVMEEINESG